MIKLAKDYYVREEKILALYKRHDHSLDENDRPKISDDLFWFAEIEGDNVDVKVDDDCAYDFLGLGNDLPTSERKGPYKYKCCSCEKIFEKDDVGYVDHDEGGCVGNIYCKDCKRDTDVLVEEKP